MSKTSRELIYEHYIQTNFSKYLTETTPQLTLEEWVEVHVLVKDVFNDQQDIIDKLTAELNKAKLELASNKSTVDAVIEVTRQLKTVINPLMNLTEIYATNDNGETVCKVTNLGDIYET